MGGNRRDIDKAVFVICNKAYLGTGWNDNFVYNNDLWEYDPLANTWTQKINFPGTPRIGATGFSIGGRGFLGLGRDYNSIYTTDFWEYNPFTNSWNIIAAFPGPARYDAPAFVINNKAYVGNSVDDSGFPIYFNDLLEYTPDSIIDTCFTKPIELVDCSSSVTGALFLPNGFSPNGDGENDLLEIYFGNINCIRNFKLVIYGRWGEKVFETTDPEFTWNGTYQNQPINPATFVYYLNTTLITGEIITKKGNISLMK